MTTRKRATIKLKHPDFIVYVSCDDIVSPFKKLTHTYSQRSVPLPSGDIIAVLADDATATFDDGLPLDSPFFFENRQYWFEIEFEPAVTKNSAIVNHKHRLIEGAFHLNRKGNVLQAALNFGNDVGRCGFKVEYQIDGKLCSANINFNIFATKMVMEQDLNLINLAIDKVYPLWRYSLISKTTQQVTKSSRNTDKFELFWLAQFERLVAELERGVKQIINSPHNRLQSFTKQQKLDRISKQQKPRQIEKALQLIASGIANPRISVSYKKLHIDTPENRFIKMVINRINDTLKGFIIEIDTKEQAKVSDSFIDKLKTWQRVFSKMTKQQLWREVGSYSGLNSDSKVLQQGTGYAKVYKVWQQLKFYLNKAGGHADISIKSVAELYEIWCFVEVMEVIKSLGFEEQKRELSQLKQVQFEKHFSKNGMAAAFEFYRSDGVEIKLAHEPTFSPNHEAENRTWLANQRPDIVLQVTLRNQESFFIIFDAKYRIDNAQINDKDAVPEDAINQMHRYRDAIIHQQKITNEAPIKSRPVMGAFALYPGFCDQTNCNNPYQDAIEQVGIGAFALLPSNADQQNHRLWLQNYLLQKLGAGIDKGLPLSNDYYFVEDAARISPYGQNAIRHTGLTMVAPVNEISRAEQYLEHARQGKLQGYHTQLLGTNRQNIHRNIIREIRYLIVTVRNEDSDAVQVGKYLYRVANVKLMPRHSIDEQLTGKASTVEQLYWLFEFSGEATKLESEIRLPYEERFKFKLTKAEYLKEVKHWNDITGELQLYAELDETW
ncbi:hypothetical protein BCU84_06705 [Shewanella sp. 10N.286.51.B7]|uniref:DUF2357 domain-containing protein n=1 Tax=Shewanella sp. 10N.286.51.B7 TaxID=1880836 RepID=UPI000C83EA84|nr:DUF2357 domain-containing protein [Shewanella sp. 10N.286.51.B7]PMG79020.1 hypothetical protein BCU84_06705 [Shewanella sp. 10N.286.51.B7]